MGGDAAALRKLPLTDGAVEGLLTTDWRNRGYNWISNPNL